MLSDALPLKVYQSFLSQHYVVCDLGKIIVSLHLVFFELLCFYQQYAHPTLFSDTAIIAY